MGGTATYALLALLVGCAMVTNAQEGRPGIRKLLKEAPQAQAVTGKPLELGGVRMLQQLDKVPPRPAQRVVATSAASDGPRQPAVPSTQSPATSKPQPPSPAPASTTGRTTFVQQPAAVTRHQQVTTAPPRAADLSDRVKTFKPYLLGTASAAQQQPAVSAAAVNKPTQPAGRVRMAPSQSWGDADSVKPGRQWAKQHTRFGAALQPGVARAQRPGEPTAMASPAPKTPAEHLLAQQPGLIAASD